MPKPAKTPTPAPTAGPAFVRLPQVLTRTGLARSTLYAAIAAGEFPRARQLGASGARSVAWLESELAEWIATRPLATNEPVKRTRRAPLALPKAVPTLAAE